MDPDDEGIERLLRMRRPEPDAEFVRALEASLSTRAASPRRARVLASACALAVALAALVSVLGVANVGPFHSTRTDDARAERECRPVPVVTPERTPVVIVIADGRVRVKPVATPTAKSVTRCR